MLAASHTTQLHSHAALERRRGLRVQETRPIKVLEPAMARFFPGQTRDLSAAGLRLELFSSVPLAVGSVLYVHVGLGEKGESLANRRQMIPVRVVWMQAGGRKGRLLAGVEFLTSIAVQRDAA